MEQKLNKLCFSLRISGSGVFLFGIWSAAKVFMMLFRDKGQTLSELMEKTTLDAVPEAERFLWLFTLIIAGLISAIMILLHYYIFRKAVAESKGLQRRSAYLVVTVLLMLGSVFSIIYILTPGSEASLSDSVSSIMLDLTQTCIFFELVTSSIRLRHLTKNLPEKRT